MAPWLIFSHTASSSGIPTKDDSLSSPNLSTNSLGRPIRIALTEIFCIFTRTSFNVSLTSTIVAHRIFQSVETNTCNEKNQSCSTQAQPVPSHHSPLSIPSITPTTTLRWALFYLVNTTTQPCKLRPWCTRRRRRQSWCSAHTVTVFLPTMVAHLLSSYQRGVQDITGATHPDEGSISKQSPVYTRRFLFLIQLYRIIWKEGRDGQDERLNWVV